MSFYTGFGGRHRWSWEDPIFLALAAAIAFPDVVLRFISEKTGKACCGWVHLIVYEVVIVAIVALATWLLMPICPRLQWWTPLVFAGMLLTIRGIIWAVLELLGLNRSP